MILLMCCACCCCGVCQCAEAVTAVPSIFFIDAAKGAVINTLVGSDAAKPNELSKALASLGKVSRIFKPNLDPILTATRAPPRPAHVPLIHVCPIVPLTPTISC